jgi:quinolinate synthase
LPENQGLIAAIQEWKAKRDAVILAHNYQSEEIQQIADFIGDSFALSRKAAASPAKTILFCGVHFMAESASLLAPEKTVLLPAPDAGCPLADFASADEVRRWRKRYPKAAVVAYINSTAEVKAEADVCCTSSNALKVIASLPEKEIIFLPDQNLGSFVADHFPDRIFHLWPGYCVTHHRVEPAMVDQVREIHPEAEILVHPECRPEVVAKADFVGSTSQLIARVGTSPAKTFIIGTEMGVIPGLQKDYPDRKFFMLTPGLVCPNMKRTTLAKVLESLKNMELRVTVPEALQENARRSLERMLAVGA